MAEYILDDTPPAGDYGVDTILPDDLEKAQFMAKRKRDQERSWGQAVWNFSKAVPSALYDFATETIPEAWEGDLVLPMIGLGDEDGDAGEAWGALGNAVNLGTRDAYSNMKAVIGAVREHFDYELNEGERDEKAWKRHQHEMNYGVARESFLNAIPEKYRKKADFLSEFLGLENVLPSIAFTKYAPEVTRKGIKKSVGLAGDALSMGGSGFMAINKVAKAPLEFARKKGYGEAFTMGQMGSVVASGAGVGNVATGTFAGVFATEVISKIAGKAMMEVGEVAKVFATPSSHARFLHRLATSDKVSKATRATASRLNKMKGTQAYDVLFNTFVAGLGSGAVQIGIEGIKGKNAEEVGQAVGEGIGYGAPFGALGKQGSGKSIEDGDGQGGLSARSQQGINNYLAKKEQEGNKEIIKAMGGLDQTSLVALSTLDELAGLGNFRMSLVSDGQARDLIEDAMKNGSDLEAPQPRVGRIPPAFYNPKDRSIYIHENRIKEGVGEIASLFLHEHGHHALREMLGSSPMTRRAILAGFETDADTGYKFDYKGADGKIMGSINVNQQAFNFARDYAMKIYSTSPAISQSLGFNVVDGENGTKNLEWSGSGDASLLSEEIGAEQWSMAYRSEPNAFKNMNKSLRHSLLDSMQESLAKLGVVEPKTGNPVESVISKSMLKNDKVKKVFDNYLQKRTEHLADRAIDIDQGRKHEPNKNSSQTSDERFTQLFGGVGVNLAMASHFHVQDQTMYDELVSSMSLIDDVNEDGFAGIGKGKEGKKLHWKTRQIFGMAGKYNNAVSSVIDMIQAGIDGRKMLKFGYRSATMLNRSDYNPFFERSVTPYAWQISPKKPRFSIKHGRTIYPNLKVMAYDADIVENNIEIMKTAGLLPEGMSVEKFKENFAKHAKSVLTETGEEGMINPDGKGENELFTMAFGLKESGDKILNPTRNEWFSSSENTMKKAFKSYDVSALAGLSTENRDGYAYDYKNAKLNYMPSLAQEGHKNSTIPSQPKRYSISNDDSRFITLPTEYSKYTDEELDLILRDPQSDYNRNNEDEKLNEGLITWGLNPPDAEMNNKDRLGSFLIGATRQNPEIFQYEKQTKPVDLKALDLKNILGAQGDFVFNLATMIEKNLASYDDMKVEIVNFYHSKYETSGTLIFSDKKSRVNNEDIHLVIEISPSENSNGIITLDTQHLVDPKRRSNSKFSGKAIYQALYDYADASGYQIKHHSLSKINKLRTTATRLSQLLKSNTDDHIVDTALGGFFFSDMTYLPKNDYVRRVTAYAREELRLVRERMQVYPYSSIEPSKQAIMGANPDRTMGSVNDFNHLDAFRFDFDRGTYMFMEYRKGKPQLDFQISDALDVTKNQFNKKSQNPDATNHEWFTADPTKDNDLSGFAKFLSLHPNYIKQGVGLSTLKRAIIAQTIVRASEGDGYSLTPYDDSPQFMQRELGKKLFFMPESEPIEVGKAYLAGADESNVDYDLILKADREWQEKGYESSFFKDWHKGEIIGEAIDLAGSISPIEFTHVHSQALSERGQFRSEFSESHLQRYGSIKGFFTQLRTELSQQAPHDGELKSTFVLKGKLWNSADQEHRNLLSDWWTQLPKHAKLYASQRGDILPKAMRMFFEHEYYADVGGEFAIGKHYHFSRIDFGKKAPNKLPPLNGINKFLESFLGKDWQKHNNSETYNKGELFFDNGVRADGDPSTYYKHINGDALQEVATKGNNPDDLNWYFLEHSMDESGITGGDDYSFNTWANKKHGFDAFRLGTEYGGQTYAVINPNAQAKVVTQDSAIPRNEFTFRSQEMVNFMPYTTLTDETAQQFDQVIDEMKKNPYGFTIDQSNVLHAETGYVVAPEKETEYTIPLKELSRTELWAYIRDHAHRFKKEGAHIGGWLKDGAQMMLDVAFPVENYLDAVRMAIWGDQDSIYDINTGTEIKTKNEDKTKQVLPENFPISIEQIERARPENLLAFADARNRDKRSIRHEGITENSRTSLTDEEVAKLPMLNSLNFMPSIPSEKVSKETAMGFPMLEFNNPNKNIKFGDKVLSEKSDVVLVKNSAHWDNRKWEAYFNDNRIADGLMDKMADNATPQAYELITHFRLGRVGKFSIPSAPTKLLDMVRNPQIFIDLLDSTMAKNPNFIKLAKDGVNSAKKMYAVTKTPEMVSQAFIWGLLSRMLDPYNQEAGWLRTTNNKQIWGAIFDSIDGKYNKKKGTFWDATKIGDEKYGWKKMPSYKKASDKNKFLKKKMSKLSKKMKSDFADEASDRNLNKQAGTWTDIVSNMFEDQKNNVSAGNNAKQNIQAIHDMLVKWNGRWSELTDIFNDKNLDGQGIREKMWSNGFLGAGVKDKVTSFVIALMADPNVIIMDRWQFVNVWEHQIQDSVKNRLKKVNAILAPNSGATKAEIKKATEQKSEFNKYGVSPYRYDQNGTPEDRSGFYKTIGSTLDNPVEHSLYRTLEYYFKDLAKSVSSMRSDYSWIDSAFAMHWVSWNMIKEEAVGHSSFDVLTEMAQQGQFPMSASARKIFVDDFINKPKYTERNERIPTEQKTRRTRFFQDAKGKPIEEIREKENDREGLGWKREGEESVYFKGVPDE